MGKSQDAKKETKKKPAKTMKEKRAEKKAKKYPCHKNLSLSLLARGIPPCQRQNIFYRESRGPIEERAPSHR